MGDKMFTLVINADLCCCRCQKEIKRYLCKIKCKYQIISIVIEVEKNQVILKGFFDAEQLKAHLLCKLSKIIISIEIVVPAPPPPPPCNKECEEKIIKKCVEKITRICEERCTKICEERTKICEERFIKIIEERTKICEERCIKICEEICKKKCEGKCKERCEEECRRWCKEQCKCKRSCDWKKLPCPLPCPPPCPPPVCPPCPPPCPPPCSPPPCPPPQPICSWPSQQFTIMCCASPCVCFVSSSNHYRCCSCGVISWPWCGPGGWGGGGRGQPSYDNRMLGCDPTLMSNVIVDSGPSCTIM